MEKSIKTLGLHETRIRLHPEVTVTVTVNVARSLDEAETQLRTGVAVTGMIDDEDEADEVEVAEVVVAEEAATDEPPAEESSTEDDVADEAAAEEASEDSDEA